MLNIFTESFKLIQKMITINAAKFDQSSSVRYDFQNLVFYVMPNKPQENFLKASIISNKRNQEKK